MYEVPMYLSILTLRGRGRGHQQVMKDNNQYQQQAIKVNTSKDRANKVKVSTSEWITRRVVMPARIMVMVPMSLIVLMLSIPTLRAGGEGEAEIPMQGPTTR